MKFFVVFATWMHGDNAGVGWFDHALRLNDNGVFTSNVQ
jgi:hypothetical protein